MKFQNLRRCGYLLTLLASTIPSVVFGQAALATSKNEFIKPLDPSNPSVNCYCPRPSSPIFNKESKRFITERYCLDFVGGKFQNKIQIDCPLYLKPSRNSSSVTQPIILALGGDEGRGSTFGHSAGETLKQGLRDEAQVERNRGNDAIADRLENMSDRLNTGNISEAEGSEIAREVAVGNFDRADHLVDRSSQ